MKITVKATMAWDKVAHEQAGDNEAMDVAREIITSSILKSIGSGRKPEFKDEIEEVIAWTANDAGTRDVMLHQIMGIAEQQGYDASRHVDDLIMKLDI